MKDLIKRILRESLLVEDYSTQKKRFIMQAEDDINDLRRNDPYEYMSGISDDEGIRVMVDKYLDIFRKAKNNREFADIVGSTDIDRHTNFLRLVKNLNDLGKVRAIGGDISLLEVASPAELVHKDDRVEIWRGNSSDGCVKIKGSEGPDWCVSRSYSNMFDTYRLGSREPTFYFIKDLNAESRVQKIGNKYDDPYFFFVIQVLGSGFEGENMYALTNSNNEGGEFPISWYNLVKEVPIISPYRRFLINVPYNNIESTKRAFGRGYRGDFKDLTYGQKLAYIDLTKDDGITDDEFIKLPRDLKIRYIGFGMGLGPRAYNSIVDDDNLMERYRSIAMRRVETMLGRGFPIRTFEKWGKWTGSQRDIVRGVLGYLFGKWFRKLSFEDKIKKMPDPKTLNMFLDNPSEDYVGDRKYVWNAIVDAGLEDEYMKKFGEDPNIDIVKELDDSGFKKEIDEKWSNKYKRSIDCSNPKGFSQRAHCQGRNT